MAGYSRGGRRSTSGSRHPSEDDTAPSLSPQASGWSAERLTEWIRSQVISYL